MYKKKESAFIRKERELKIIEKTTNYVFKKELSEYNGFIPDNNMRLQRDIILSFMFELGINIDDCSEILECKRSVVSESLFFNDWELAHTDRNPDYIESNFDFMVEFNKIKDIYKEKERSIDDIYKQ